MLEEAVVKRVCFDFFRPNQSANPESAKKIPIVSIMDSDYIHLGKMSTEMDLWINLTTFFEDKFIYYSQLHTTYCKILLLTPKYHKYHLLLRLKATTSKWK